MGNFYWTNFDSIWNHFDSVMGDWQRLTVESKKQLSYLPSYPHSDCWVDDEGKHLYLRFALAGYSKDNISVQASKNVLRVIAKGDKEDAVKFIHHGISKKDIDFSLTLDKAFSLEKAKTSFEDGLLTIQVSRAKDAKVIDLF